MPLPDACYMHLCDTPHDHRIDHYFPNINDEHFAADDNDHDHNIADNAVDHHLHRRGCDIDSDRGTGHILRAKQAEASRRIGRVCRAKWLGT